MAPTISVGGIHLVNSSGTPTAGGAATAASTTPFSIRHGYTIGSAEPAPLWSGGPPLRNGSTLIGRAYANVEERIPIAVLGSTHENAVARLQELKRALATALYSSPAILVVQPTASSTAMYSEVYSATVQETTQDEFEAWEGSVDLEAEIVWTRAPFFGNLSAGETLINAVTFNNTGTGSPDNIDAFTTGAGDLIYEGGPLNIKFLPTTAGSNPAALYLASIASRVYQAFTGTTASNTTTFTSIGAPGSAFTATSLLTNRGLKARVVARFSAMSANAEIRVAYGAAALPIQRTRGVIPGISTATWVDFGPLNLTSQYLASVTAADDISLVMEVRSTNGSAVAVTCAYIEVLLYYDFCRLQVAGGQNLTVASNEYIYVDSFVTKTNYPALPRERPRAWVYSSGNVMNYSCEIRGTPPRYYSGASLYAAWVDISKLHTTTWAATLTATHAPLFKTLRGAG